VYIFIHKIFLFAKRITIHTLKKEEEKNCGKPFLFTKHYHKLLLHEKKGKISKMFCEKLIFQTEKILSFLFLLIFDLAFNFNSAIYSQEKYKIEKDVFLLFEDANVFFSSLNFKSTFSTDEMLSSFRHLFPPSNHLRIWPNYDPVFLKEEI
jgi:hypothetical protein